MKRLPVLAVLLMLVAILQGRSVQAQAPTTTADTYVQPYTANFMYGSNMGYYGSAWPDEALANLINTTGGHSIRPFLPDYFLSAWGFNIRTSTFAHYTNTLGMQELVCAIGEPSPGHRDPAVYTASGTTSSKLFANLYEPIWNPDGTVNQQNYYAYYVYQLIQTYGDHIRIWEVVNEPDFTGGNPSNWLTRAPLPEEMQNTLAPFYHYIRTLRITWEVVKRYSPDDYVTPGGLGYHEFLDALLRYTDNPNAGAVSAAYPATGGAYFDMLSYHVYPSYYLRSWDNAISGFRHHRTSDYAATQVITHKNDMQAVLQRHGYDGLTHPRKPFILTETNISRRSTDVWRISSDEMQRNFGIKALILAQKNDIRQLYFYSIGESAVAPPPGTAVSVNDEYALMGLYENLTSNVPGQEIITELGVGFKTTSQLLYGWQYDATRTAALQLSAGIEGAAFSKQGQYAYSLWAKAVTDGSETATATYTFPATWRMSGATRHEWDFARTAASTPVSSQSVTLSGAPSFFLQSPQHLPVELVAFTARRVGAATVQLRWRTASEHNSAGFTVEKSTDGQHFTAHRTVAGRGNSTAPTDYQVADDTTAPAAYYRLTQHDHDGTKSYSSVVFVAASPELAELVAYPNPTSTTLTVAFYSPIATQGQIEVRDLLGRVVSRQSLAVQAGPNAVPVACAQLRPGQYLVQVRTAAAVLTTRVTKQ